MEDKKAAFILVDILIEYIVNGFLEYKLTKNDILVLTYLSARMDAYKNYSCWPSQETIRIRTKLSRSAICRSLKSLSDQNIIIIKMNKCNSYSLVFKEMHSISWENLELLRSKKQQRCVPQTHPVDKHDEQNINDVSPEDIVKLGCVSQTQPDVSPRHINIKYNKSLKTNNSLSPIGSPVSMVDFFPRAKRVKPPSPIAIDNYLHIPIRVSTEGGQGNPVIGITGHENYKNEQNLTFDDFKNHYPKNPFHSDSFAEAKRIWKKNNYDVIAEKIIFDVTHRIKTIWSTIDPRFIPISKTYLEDRLWEEPVREGWNKKSSANQYAKNETRCTVPEWGPGHETWESIYGN